MKYTDWITELQANLLSVSEAERRKVLDYYAEAYADRRAAGFSESEIIEGFGAPYDAAQAILENDTAAENGTENSTHICNSKQTPPPPPPAPAPLPAPSPAPSPAPKKKKHGVVIAVSIIAAVLILSLLCSLISLGIGCAISPEFTDATYVQQSENLQNIRIDFAIGEIETVFYDGDKIEIDYHTSNIYSVDINEKNGTITFKLRTKRWRVSWGIINHPQTVVKLPESSVYNLELYTSAGSAIINGGTFGDLKIDMSAGSVRLKDSIVCKKLDIDLSAGRVGADTVECSSITVDLSAGQAEIDRLVCPDIDIDLSAGQASLGVVGVQAEYTIKVAKSAGSCNVQNQTGTDPSKRIEVDLSAGSVTVRFTD